MFKFFVFVDKFLREREDCGVDVGLLVLLGYVMWEVYFDLRLVI